MPMLSSRLLRSKHIKESLTMMPAIDSVMQAEEKGAVRKKGIALVLDRWQSLFRSIEALYRRLLSWSLSHRPDT
ncbi:MAG: hypothetical protein AB9903_14635 [Vulcanimicrobiota bacterium]